MITKKHGYINMKRKVITFLVFVMVATNVIHGTIYTGTCGPHLTLSYNDSTKVMDISGYGDMTSSPHFYGMDADEVRTVNLPNGITSICDNAFESWSRLSHINIPNSLTSIGSEAFSDCYSLSSIVLGENLTTIGNRVFANCGLTSIIIPNSVTSIGTEAFSECHNLRSIVLGENLTTIGYSAFANCGLTSIVIPNSVTYLGEEAFAHCDALTSVVIGNGISRIEESAFASCAATDVKIGSGVIEIRADAFEGCTQLRNLIIGENVTTIKEDAFNYCVSLTSVTIPNSVRFIGSEAFSYSGLKSIIIPNNVESINDAFYHCDSLESVTIGSGVRTIGIQAFADCNRLKSVVVGENVEHIDGEAFSMDTSLTSITFLNGVYNIDDHAFYHCIKLDTLNLLITEDSKRYNTLLQVESLNDTTYSGTTIRHVNILEGSTCLQSRLFENCKYLESVVIPERIDSLPPYTFAGCTSLRSISSTHNMMHSAPRFAAMQETEDYCPTCDVVINIPNTVKRLAAGCLSGCTQIQQLTIPNSIVNNGIGNEVFAGCTNLTDVTINCNVTAFESGGKNYRHFDNCPNIKRVKLLSANEDRLLFSSAPKFIQLFHSALPSIEKVIYLDGSTDIQWAGSDDRGENNPIEIPHLKTIVIPSTVQNIGPCSFVGCTALTDITLPISLQAIGDYSFAQCTALGAIDSKAKTAPALQSNVFKGLELKNINLTTPSVPEAQTYDVAEIWKDFRRIGHPQAITVNTYGTQVGNITSGSANIQWSSNSNARKTKIYTEDSQGGTKRLYVFSSDDEVANSNLPQHRTENRLKTDEEGVDGFELAITDLVSSTTYDYSVSMYDIEENLLEEFTGSFTTIGEQGIEEVTPSAHCGTQKIIENGQILILRGDKTYTLAGQEVR